MSTRLNYKDEMERGIASIQAQGQGVYEIAILFPWNIPELLLRCDEQAARVLVMLNQAIANMAKGKPPALCLLCDHVFRKKQAPAAFVLLLAAVGDPSASIASGLCYPCAVKDRLTERVAQKYKDSMIADLRVLPHLSAPGRA